MRIIAQLYRKHYKFFLVIPFVILLLAAIQIAHQTALTGDFMIKGVSLKGGLSITVSQKLDIGKLKGLLTSAYPDKEIIVRAVGKGTLIEVPGELDPKELAGLLKTEFSISDEQISAEVMGSSLGESFFKETIRAVIIAFAFMAFVVFLYFKAPIPSLAVIFSAASDIIVTLAIVNTLGIQIGTAGIAAFLMLIGYSVDTDILLTSRVLKRSEGNVYERIVGAAKTGFLMTGTTMAAVTIGMILTTSAIIRQIMIIVLIGLAIDLVNTWLGNAVMIRWYAEKNAKD